jgi:hypothetical protein
MIRLISMIVLVITCAGDRAAAQGLPATQWTILAVNVTKMAPPGLAPDLSTAPGVKVTARLHLAGRFIAGIDAAKSKVDAFTDDRKTNLLQDKKNPLSFSILNALADDGGHMVASFRASGVPAPGAQKLRITGAVALDVARSEKTVEKKDVSLKQGVDLKVGILELKMTVFKNSESIHYSGERPLKSLVLLDAQGQEIAIKGMSRPPLLTPGDGGGRYRVVFRTAAKVDRCTVRAVYYEDVEQVLVPFDLSVGVGL